MCLPYLGFMSHAHPQLTSFNLRVMVERRGCLRESPSLIAFRFGAARCAATAFADGARDRLRLGPAKTFGERCASGPGCAKLEGALEAAGGDGPIPDKSIGPEGRLELLAFRDLEGRVVGVLPSRLAGLRTCFLQPGSFRFLRGICASGKNAGGGSGTGVATCRPSTCTPDETVAPEDALYGCAMTMPSGAAAGGGGAALGSVIDSVALCAGHACMTTCIR